MFGPRGLGNYFFVSGVCWFTWLIRRCFDSPVPGPEIAGTFAILLRTLLFYNMQLILMFFVRHVSVQKVSGSDWYDSTWANQCSDNLDSVLQLGIQVRSCGACQCSDNLEQDWTTYIHPLQASEVTTWANWSIWSRPRRHLDSSEATEWVTWGIRSDHLN